VRDYRTAAELAAKAAEATGLDAEGVSTAASPARQSCRPVQTWGCMESRTRVPGQVSNSSISGGPQVRNRLWEPNDEVTRTASSC
jgi:hypothetical protein